jgi:hypothetical protein
MPSKIYETGFIRLTDNTELEIEPLKLKYFREFMNIFETSKDTRTEDELIDVLIDCVRICMKQFYTELKTVEDVADNVNLPTIYDIIYFATNIKMGHRSEEAEQTQNANGSEKSSWESLDLNKLESEVFLLGAWKNYNELELSLSMTELLLTLEAKRDLDYQEKKFLAAMQGIDIDEGQQKEDPWEAMQARVAAKMSGQGNGDPNDITSLQGVRASQVGFGIGMGLDYATEI